MLKKAKNKSFNTVINIATIVAVCMVILISTFGAVRAQNNDQDLETNHADDLVYHMAHFITTKNPASLVYQLCTDSDDKDAIGRALQELWDTCVGVREYTVEVNAPSRDAAYHAYIHSFNGQAVGISFDEWYKTVYGGSPSKIVDVMTSDGQFNKIFAVVMMVLKGIAGFWLIILITTEIVGDIEKGQEPAECAFRAMMHLALTGIFVLYSEKIVYAILIIGQVVIEYATNAQSNGSILTPAALFDMALSGEKYTGDFLQWLRCFGTFMIPFLASIICYGLAVFLVIQLCLEVAIRRALCPLAVVDVHKEGIRSLGARYLKKLFATVLKLAICLLLSNTANIVSLAVMGYATGVSLGEALIGILMVVIVNFSVVGMMFKSGEYANDALGV